MRKSYAALRMPAGRNEVLEAEDEADDPTRAGVDGAMAMFFFGFFLAGGTEAVPAADTLCGTAILSPYCDGPPSTSGSRNDRARRTQACSESHHMVALQHLSKKTRHNLPLYAVYPARPNPELTTTRNFSMAGYDQ